MLPVTTEYSKQIQVAAPVKTLKEFFSDYPRAFGELFPGLEEFIEEGPETYRWRFEKFSYTGMEYQVEFSTRFQWSADTLEITSTSAPGNATLTGKIKLSDSRIDFLFALEAELPLPRFMGAMVAPLTERELKKLFDRYVQHVEETI